MDDVAEKFTKEVPDINIRMTIVYVAFMAGQKFIVDKLINSKEIKRVSLSTSITRSKNESTE